MIKPMEQIFSNEVLKPSFVSLCTINFSIGITTEMALQNIVFIVVINNIGCITFILLSTKLFSFTCAKG